MRNKLPVTSQIRLYDLEPATDRVLREVLMGLQKPVKELPCKLLYDERGSHLFNQICQLDEYYLTRTETAIMRRYVEEMVSGIGPGCLLIEYGSGNSAKSRLLLNTLPDVAGYVPIDISKEHLVRVALVLRETYPGLDVLPVCADYTKPFEIPCGDNAVLKKVVYFPGSTIGNFHPREAVEFLKRTAQLCGPDGGLLIGVDLVKDSQILDRAYNDRNGITAEFNLNILVRLNRELDANFDLHQFKHYASYNESAGRIEMHLLSLADQTVRLDGVDIFFEAGENIWTESSYKYTLDEFENIGLAAGFKTERVWTDNDCLFSVQYLTPVSSRQNS